MSEKPDMIAACQPCVFPIAFVFPIALLIAAGHSVPTVEMVLSKRMPI
jgi:hypothetical protein